MSVHQQAEALVAMLRERKLRLGVAESCTGGLLGAAITDIPGASEAFCGGVIAYEDAIKTSTLGLDAKRLEKHGAVSAWAVEAMAHAVRDLLGCEVGIAISGVAGPGGGTMRKPVGTVWIGISGPEQLFDAHRLKLKGDRAAVRQQAVEAALKRAAEMVSEATLEGVA